VRRPLRQAQRKTRGNSATRSLPPVIHAAVTRAAAERQANPMEPRVTAADAIGLAAHRPDSLVAGLLIDLLQAGHVEAFRRPDGVLAFRVTAAGRKALADGEEP
jgi:hypothetical protein